MNEELNSILAKNEVVLQKTEELFKQLAECKAREDYVAVSLAEGEKIARNITDLAQTRVNNIMDNLNETLHPRQEELLFIEKEIKFLSEEVYREEAEPDVGTDMLPHDNNKLQTEEIDNAASQSTQQEINKEEINERNLQVDTFVDIRYWDNSNGQKQMQNHALQLIIDIEVPENNYSVNYTRVSSDIISAVQRYNNVDLNDIFPFDIIEPNVNNVAMYFYNYLENAVLLMDLCLNVITIRELPDLNIKINTRNTEFDDLLHHGKNDILSGIREALPDEFESEKPEPPQPPKKPDKIYVAGEGWIDVSRWR